MHDIMGCMPLEEGSSVVQKFYLDLNRMLVKKIEYYAIRPHTLQ